MGENKIFEMLGNSLHKIKLVFISSCHSERVGAIFSKAGVKHVIAIREDEPVSNDAASLFAEKFYSFIFNHYTICDSFYKAKKYIQDSATLNHEAFKFIIIREEDKYFKKRRD